MPHAMASCSQLDFELFMHLGFTIPCDNDDGEQMTLADILMKIDPINQEYIIILITNITAFVSFAISVKKEKGSSSCLGVTTIQPAANFCRR